jgi:hypothetical protein
VKAAQRQVLYTSVKNKMGFCYIHTGVIQRAKGYTALARLAYQTCGSVNDGFRRVSYRAYAAHHLGGLVLLPRHAPAELADLLEFVAAVGLRENRRDAQEGRIVDFAIPRQVPPELLLAVAAFVLLPFVELGMSIRIDVECPPASDGEPNPHAHAYLAMREVDRDGFGAKERSWNQLFWRDGGRHVRSIIAARLTLACAILCIDAHVDPRHNEAKGADTPELRLPGVLFRMYEAGRSVHQIENLKAQRHDKKTQPTQRHAPKVTPGLMITNAAASKNGTTKVAAFRQAFAEKAMEVGYALEAMADEPPEAPLSLAGTAVSFDGVAFRLKENCEAEDADIVVLFARVLGWPSLVVEGDAKIADLIAVAGASIDMFMVNRSPSPAVRHIISQTNFERFKAAIARADRLGIVAKLLADVAPGSAAAPPGEGREDVVAASVTEIDVEPAGAAIPAEAVLVQPGPEVSAEPDSEAGLDVAPSAEVIPNSGDRAAMDPTIISGPSLDGLESLPDDDSWQIKPDPNVVRQNARHVQAYYDRLQRRVAEAEEIASRMTNRVKGRDPRPP